MFFPMYYAQYLLNSIIFNKSRILLCVRYALFAFSCISNQTTNFLKPIFHVLYPKAPYIPNELEEICSQARRIYLYVTLKRKM